MVGPAPLFFEGDHGTKRFTTKNTKAAKKILEVELAGASKMITDSDPLSDSGTRMLNPRISSSRGRERGSFSAKTQGRKDARGRPLSSNFAPSRLGGFAFYSFLQSVGSKRQDAPRAKRQSKKCLVLFEGAQGGTMAKIRTDSRGLERRRSAANWSMIDHPFEDPGMPGVRKVQSGENRKGISSKMIIFKFWPHSFPSVDGSCGSAALKVRGSGWNSGAPGRRRLAISKSSKMRNVLTSEKLSTRASRRRSSHRQPQLTGSPMDFVALREFHASRRLDWRRSGVARHPRRKFAGRSNPGKGPEFSAPRPAVDREIRSVNL